MKSKIVVACALGFVFAAAASAQNKISGTVSCGAPDPAYSVEAGDRPGHTLSLTKSSCTWSTPMQIEGEKTKEGSDVTSGDASGEKSRSIGYHVSTMTNGDKIFVHYTGTDVMSKDGKPVSTSGTWSFSGGTGKLKVIAGKGTYKGKADGGNMPVEVEGEYTLPAKK